jgi:hypothetical protein
MKRDIERPAESLPGSPWLCAAIAVVLAAVGGLTTPERLIALGPMRRSLTSGVASVRDIARAEVLLFSLGCLLLSGVFALVAVRWRRIQGSGFVRRVGAFESRETAAHAALMRPLNGPLLVVAVCTALGLLHVAFCTRVFNAAQLRLINQEDGVIEYATAALLMVCCIVSAVLAFRFRGQKARVVVHALLAVGFFLMTGEEISWGQRIFGFETEGLLGEGNVQNETNLHNMFGYFADHLFIAGVFVGGFMLPMLAYRRAFFRKLFAYAGLPIASPGLAIGFLLVSMLHDWTLYRVLPPVPGLRIAELRELLTAVGFAMLMGECRLLSRATGQAAAARPSAESGEGHLRSGAWKPGV